MYMVESLRTLGVVALLALLVACGGGGEGDGAGIPDGSSGRDVTAPQLVSQRPAADGSAPIDVIVALTFDEEIDPASISEETIRLDGPGGPVTGTVSYTPGLKQLSFMPDSHLLAFSSYRVARAEIADRSGNAVEAPHGWSFTTIFDQLPPELPEF